jgi:hypothetical protein
MRTRKTIMLLAMVLILFSGCVQEQAKITEPATADTEGSAAAGVYESNMTPDNFVSGIENKYFTLTPGKKMVYRAQTEDGIERNEVYITYDTRRIMDVTTVVVWDRVWLNDDLTEDTKDWYAQDKYGNIWYFGEDTKELIAGKVTTTHGSWEAGVDGGKPGMIMKGTPVVGDSYRQEYLVGTVEDMGKIVSLDESVSVPFGKLTGCVKTVDWTPLEPGVTENKYYCPQVGGVALEVGVEDGERVELISVEYNAQPSPSVVEKQPEQLKTKITEAEAKEIALKRVRGTVTDIAIETKFGKPTYVVEIMPDYGYEVDVIIDIDTGEVLAVES